MSGHKVNHHWVASLLLVAFLFVAPVTLGQQSPVIQPCPAPSPVTRSHSRRTEVIEKRADISPTLIDSEIPEDLATERMLEPYSAKVRALDLVIGKVEGDLRKGGFGAGSLGNFVADSMKDRASRKLGRSIALAVTNSGGLRKSVIREGDLRARDIFEVMPFENALVEIDLTGEQVLKLLGIVLVGHHAQSGAKIRYRVNVQNKPELVSSTLVNGAGNEQTIHPKSTYTIITSDYLVKLASGDFSVLQEGKNVRGVGVTLRDAIIDYVRAETAAGRPVRVKLDGRFKSVKTPGQ